MALRLEITAPGAAPREIPLLPGRTEVAAGPREQYRLIGDAGEIPANVRVLRVENALVVTGLPDGQALALQDFFRVCRPGADCTLSFAGPGAPEAVVANDSPSLAALTDGSFLLFGPVESGAPPAAYTVPSPEERAMSPWAIGLAALLGIGVVGGAAGGGGGGGDAAPTGVLGANETLPPSTGATPAPTPAPTPTPTPPVAPADTVAPTLRIADSVAAPSTNAPATFTFAFSEPVVGFDAADVAVSGGTKGALAGGTDSRTWTMVVTPAAGVAAGEVAVSVAAGAATDAAGNPIAAVRATQAVDTLGPVATIVDDTPAATTNRPVGFTIAFSEPASGFVLADVAVTGGIAGALTALGGDRYALAVTPTPGQPAGTIAVGVAAGGVADALGNPNAASPIATQAYDTAAPAQRVFAFAVTDDQAPRIGTLSLGEVTNDRSPTLTLTLDAVLGPGEVLSVSRDGAALATRTAGQAFTVGDVGLGPGLHEYAASIADAAGNVSPLDLNGLATGTTFSFTIA